MDERLAESIAKTLVMASREGVPMKIEVGIGTPSTTALPPIPIVAETPSVAPKPPEIRLTEIDRMLLMALKKNGVNNQLTLMRFASETGMNEAEARSAMRGSGRDGLSVKDDLYERFDTKRPGGGKVRTYKLTARGKEYVKNLD